MMLRLIVETAIHWMQIGLPLKILKIVVFSRDNKELDKNPLLAYYKELKQKWAGILKNENDQPQVGNSFQLHVIINIFSCIFHHV